jgi:hypothetical protein
LPEATYSNEELCKCKAQICNQNEKINSISVRKFNYLRQPSFCVYENEIANSSRCVVIFLAQMKMSGEYDE